MLTVKEALIQARALIADIDHWCQGEHAQDNAGGAARFDDETAHCFCAAGAMARVCGVEMVDGEFVDNGGPLYEASERAIRAATRRLFPAPTVPGVADLGNFVALNDGENGIPDDFDGDTYALAHANVLKVFDAAIEACGE